MDLDYCAKFREMLKVNEGCVDTDEAYYDFVHAMWCDWILFPCWTRPID